MSADRGFDLTVVVCTRNRPEHLRRVIDALDLQEWQDFRVVIIDQSDSDMSEIVRSSDRVTIVRDDHRGLSRARNLAIQCTATPWLAFVDDDCVPEPTWAREVARALLAHPEVEFVSGYVGADDDDGGDDDDHVPVSGSSAAEERILSGRWVRPWLIGLGVCMIVRRTAVERLGGWDERLGAGTADFPAAEDVDFNYRLLRSGGVAYVAPSIRSSHTQWRNADELVDLFGGYMRSWSAFAMKHLRTGDLTGGLWLWSLGVLDASRMLASALRRRSRVRLRLARAKLRGLVRGTVSGLRYPW